MIIQTIAGTEEMKKSEENKMKIQLSSKSKLKGAKCELDWEISNCKSYHRPV